MSRSWPTGAHLPGEALDNDALARFCGPLPADVLDGIQVKRRHWMVDPATGAHTTSTSQMATAAARQALERAGVQAWPDRPDRPVHRQPHYLLPEPPPTSSSSSAWRCAVIEVRAGCAGAVQAHDIARRLLADGTYTTALVIGAEAVSPLLAPVFLGRDPERVRMRDRLTVYTFGYGAGALVLRAGEEGSAHGRPRPVFATRSWAAPANPACSSSAAAPTPPSPNSSAAPA